MTTILNWPIKDPGELLDYQLDWTARLVFNRVQDSITGSSWAVTSGAGLTIQANTYAPKTTTVWLTSGVAGTVYTLTNTITTAGGRTMVQSVTILIANK